MAIVISSSFGLNSSALFNFERDHFETKALMNAANPADYPLDFIVTCTEDHSIYMLTAKTDSACTWTKVGGVGAGAVTMEESNIGSLAKRYTFKSEGTEIGTIDIPKDMVVTSGSVETLTTEITAYTYDVYKNGTSYVYIENGTALGEGIKYFTKTGDKISFAGFLEKTTTTGTYKAGSVNITASNKLTSDTSGQIKVAKGTYIKLLIANQAEPIYINTGDIINEDDFIKKGTDNPVAASAETLNEAYYNKTDGEFRVVRKTGDTTYAWKALDVVAKTYDADTETLTISIG